MDDELGKDDNKDDEELTSRQGTSEILPKVVVPKKQAKKVSEIDIPKTHIAAKNADADPPASQYTVKEILDEILDCQVVRQYQNQSQECRQDKTSQEAPVHRHVEAGTSTVVTVKQILGEVLNYSVRRPAAPADFHEPGPSGGARPRSDYRVYRAGVVNSSDALHDESRLGAPAKVLPSYSSVLRMGPSPRRHAPSSEKFPPRLPPPSYAEVEGLWDAAGAATSPSAVSWESDVLGPDPLYLVCPVCRTVVVTDVERERSSAAHVLALVLCLLLCWPCCLLPYCMHSCSYSYHSCPNCRHYFGMYRPPF